MRSTITSRGQTVIPAEIGGATMIERGGTSRGRDLLELVQPPREAGGAPQVLLLRWNGFGFTGIESEP